MLGEQLFYLDPETREDKMNTLSTQAKEQCISPAMRWQMEGEERGLTKNQLAHLKSQQQC